MKLRNGKTLRPVAMKRNISPRVVRNLTKVFEELSVAETLPDNIQAKEEVKKFSRYFLYHCIEDLASRFRIEKLEEENGGKTTFQEMINWRADERFWRENFFPAWLRMRNEFSLAELLCSEMFYS